jgi:hypothetical protein
MGIKNMRHNQGSSALLPTTTTQNQDSSSRASNIAFLVFLAIAFLILAGASIDETRKSEPSFKMACGAAVGVLSALGFIGCLIASFKTCYSRPTTTLTAASDSYGTFTARPPTDRAVEEGATSSFLLPKQDG